MERKIMEIFAQTLFGRETIDMSKILVVEDEPNVRKLVVMNLIKRGYEVLEAENGQKALEHIYDQKPELMILDVKLPDLTGWDVLDRLTSVPALPQNFSVVVMTASPVDRDTVLNQYPHVADVITKPFNTDKLISVIQSALSKKSALSKS